MILVDTSVWVDHLHRAEPRLGALLERDLVGVHPMVIAELALGSLAHRRQVLALLQDLRCPPILTEDELLGMIETHRLSSRGIGVVDAHLLGSALLEKGSQLWTRDKRLRAACGDVGVTAVTWR
ncbi:MAG TPA: type II toxin-antitoxin system VapC family toxin [Brachybacterium sp.]|nr:type II toxin-antitoxin system VapC family toxin [Brachybacterium sp.]HLS33909.1 type II toxin-antitoxin system VapC family toxin [Brevibacterium sp.]